MHSNDYYQVDYYDYQDIESNYIEKEDYSSIKQQNPEIIDKRLGSIQTLLERQDIILSAIGPGLVGVFVLISSVVSIYISVVSISEGCASVAKTDSTTSNSLLKWELMRRNSKIHSFLKQCFSF